MAMLTIRASQLAFLEGALVREFVDNLTRFIQEQRHSFAFAAGGPRVVRDLVDASVQRGRGFGLRSRDHLTTWVEWECEFGSKFYELEKWEWLLAILKNGLDPAIRIYRIENRLLVLRNRGAL